MSRMPERIPMKVSIGRVQSNCEDDYVKIDIIDSLSSRTFVNLKMTMTEFALLITGLSNCEAMGEVQHLEKVGRKMEHRSFAFEIGSKTVGGKKEALKAIETACPEGWEPDLGFNSQDTFFEKDGKDYARTTIRRWVKPTAEDIENAKKDW